jgi:hypothetical protein
MLGALIHCWVQLAGVSGGEKTYLGSSIIIKIYPALSLAIGGRDGMDGSGGHWMTHSNYRTCHHSQSWLSGHFLAVGRVWRGFRVGENYIQANKTLFCNLFGYWGAGWDGLKQAPLDDTFYTSSIKVLDEHPRRRGCWAIFPIDIYIYMSSHNINIPILPFTMPQGMREWMDGHG